MISMLRFGRVCRWVCRCRHLGAFGISYNVSAYSFGFWVLGFVMLAWSYGLVFLGRVLSWVRLRRGRYVYD